MKAPEQVVAGVESRLRSTWAAAVTGAAATGNDAGSVAWPQAFAIGEVSSAQLAADFGAVVRLVHTWRTWAAERGVQLRYANRRVASTAQELPTHVLVPDLDTAARLAGGTWPARISRGRARAAVLAGRYANLERPERTLAAVDKLSDVDFDLLCRAADWFAAHDGSGLTPRQVPIAGLHAKWLNTRRALVAELAGVGDLGLLPEHPARIHFTYLDPGYRAAGGRLHDSATVGDDVALPYRPQVVVISENKDTAIHFPPLAGGVSVEGVGKGGSTAASFDWIVSAPRVIYWGDMDADGLEILDGFRDAGVPATSILMDPATYDTWERFGTNVDKAGKPLGPRLARPVPHLTDDERALYVALIAPDLARHRRVEQERIPLTAALEAVRADTGR